MADAEAVVRGLVAQVMGERGLTGPVEVRALSSGGANFTSALFSISVADLKLFAKVAIIGEKMRIAMNAETLFMTEQFVYNELVKIYNGLLAKHPAAKPFRFPKVYATLPDLGRESVLMEDLSAQGYKAPSRHEPVDWRLASAAVSQLATFHAFSFAYEKENPEEFAELVERFRYKPTFSPENEEMMKATWKKMIEGAIQVANVEHREKLREVLSVMEGFTKFKTPISRTVLAHGDYRPSNLMYNEEAGRVDVVVIDYQTLHSGSPATDLLYFIFLGTDRGFRARHYQHLLRRYHEDLGSALAGLGLDVAEEYPEEVFRRDVQELLVSALHVAVVMLPIVTVEEAAAPQTSGDGDLNQFAVPPNARFAERFAALVADCADWGAI